MRWSWTMHHQLTFGGDCCCCCCGPCLLLADCACWGCGWWWTWRTCEDVWCPCRGLRARGMNSGASGFKTYVFLSSKASSWALICSKVMPCRLEFSWQMEIKCSQNFLKRGRQDVAKYENLCDSQYFWNVYLGRFSFLHEHDIREGLPAPSHWAQCNWVSHNCNQGLSSGDGCVK